MNVGILNDDIIVKLGTKRSFYDKTSSNWDESAVEGKVKQILITYGVDDINSIQMVYELQNQKLKLAPRHGGDGDNFYSIRLRVDEYFTSIRGHYGVSETSFRVIKSLRFDTNLGSFGPFGCEEGTPFSFHFTSSQSFRGFHGCSDSKNLTAIGVYLDISILRRFQYPAEQSDASQY